MTENANKEKRYIKTYAGIGDNLYQRPFIKALSIKYDIFLDTPLPEIYHDLDVTFVNEKPKIYPRIEEISFLHYWNGFESGINIFDYFGQRCGYPLHNIETLDNSLPIKEEWGFAFRTPKPLCLVRPPTLRKSFINPARNPDIKYFQHLINRHKEDYYFVSIGNLSENETLAGAELTGIDKEFMHGELSIGQVFYLMNISKLVICSPSFFVPAALALGCKCFCIFGGYVKPELLISPKINTTNFFYAAPEPFCNCRDAMHECNKEINLDILDQKFDRIKLIKKTIGTPAGLGDMHWVLTKMESFKKKNGIDWLKMVIHEDGCHTNSKAFLELIPFVDEVETRPDPLPFDFHIRPPSARRSFRPDSGVVDYLIEFNTQLELGHRIETMLPGYDINFNYPIRKDFESTIYATQLKQKVGGKLILLYTSSNGMFHAWTGGTWLPKDWVNLATQIHEFTGCQPVLIGKEWDLDYVNEMKRLDTNNIIYNLAAQTNIQQVLALIHEANLLIGFPSGLTILATHFKTPVVMFWSIKGITPNGIFIKEFMTSWVDPKALDLGIYLPFIYGDKDTNPDKIFTAIKRFI